jgi:hypothetical protein
MNAKEHSFRSDLWPSLRVVDPVEDPESLDVALDREVLERALEGSLPAVSLSNPSKGSMLYFNGDMGLCLLQKRSRKNLRSQFATPKSIDLQPHREKPQTRGVEHDL